LTVYIIIGTGQNVHIGASLVLTVRFKSYKIDPENQVVFNAKGTAASHPPSWTLEPSTATGNADLYLAFCWTGTAL